MKFFITLFSLVFYLEVSACDICGNFMGITPYDNQNQLTLLHRYRVFNGYRNYQQRSVLFIPGAYKTMHNPGAMDSVVEVKNHSARDYETFKVIELRGKYFLGPRLELNVILPVQQIKTRYNGVETTTTGLADPSLFAAWHLIRRLGEYRVKQRLIAGAGIKFPVGNYKSTDHHNQRFFLLTQNGSGSWDHFYYLNYIARAKRIGVNSNSMIKLNGTNSYGERLGHSFNQSLSVFVPFSYRSLNFFPAVLANYEYNKGVYLNDHLVPNTNMNLLMLGPSLDLVRKNLVLNVCYQFNARERVSSESLSASGRIIVGLTWNFSQMKYLIFS